MSRHRPGPKRPAQALPSARALALDARTSCLRGQEVQPALDQALTRAAAARPLDPRDAALATELVYGTLRHFLRLQYVLSHHLRNPDGLPGPMRLVLAVAAYEILCLDKVPAYASVHWATEHVKSVINPRLAKVSNAVLRAVSDLGPGADDDDFYREGAADEAEFLSRRYACPRWLTALWLHEVGPDGARSLLRAALVAPPLGLRLRLAVPGAARRLAELQAAPGCIETTDSGVALAAAPEDLPELLESGMAVRQSLAGQKAMLALGAARWPRPVWDACAGRGGKSFLLADAAPGTVFSSDPNARRLRGLAAERRRLGLDTVAPLRARAEQFQPRTPLPAILLDAPCTGLGVLSRRPDATLRRTPQDVADLVAVQARLLDHAATVLAPGGALAYVTCTVTRAENQSQIASFLDRHSGFTLETEHATPLDSPLGEFFYGALLRKS